MRFWLIVILIASLNSCRSLNYKITNKNNNVVAHRGAWKQKHLPENSIASLKNAIDLECAASEFDVRMTLDGVLVVYHDKDYNGLPIEETKYANLIKFKLSNGEKLPKLNEYLLAGIKNNRTTGLICEIKPSKSKERSKIITKKVVNLITKLKATPYITSYVSFDYDVLKRIIEINPKAKTQYLNGDKSPDELKSDGISGLDYHFSVFKKHPEWVTRAKEIGLTLNAWTINTVEDLDWLLVNNFDYITTDEPELLFKRINKKI